MTKNELRLMVINTIHKRHNQFRRERYGLPSQAWEQHNDDVREEIPAQADAIIEAITPYLDL